MTMELHKGKAAVEALVKSAKGCIAGEWKVRQEGSDYEVYPYRNGPPPVGAWSAFATCHDQYDEHNQAKKHAKHIANCSPKRIKEIAEYVAMLESRAALSAPEIKQRSE